MSDYPVPSYAAQIWVAGDQLWLAFPSLVNGHGHSVPFPANEIGLSLALETLKERSKGAISLGLRGSPTRHEIERRVREDSRYNTILREMSENKRASEAERAEASKFLEELGL